MSPKPRKEENRSLPARWRFKHGAYYYRVPPGLQDRWDGKQEFRLGKTMAEAYRTWAERLENDAEAHTIAELLDRYLWQVVPLKAPKSQESNCISIRKLRPVFGHMRITELRPVHVFKYRDMRAKQGRTAANRDLEVLSHAYTKAIEWGLCENHPIKGKVGKLSTPPRTRYVEDWEIQEVLKVADPFMTAYIHLKLLTGQRRGDLLTIKLADLKDDGIYIRPRKTRHSTNKSLIIEWTPELKQAIERIQALPYRVASIWLFRTRLGQPYVKENGTANAFDSRWQRFMQNALKKTKLKVRFTEHDLRAKVASDTDISHAQKLLGHNSLDITERIYRRAPSTVKPIK